jgi:FkbM family methyltransferase
VVIRPVHSNLGHLLKKCLKGARVARNPAMRSALRQGTAASVEHQALLRRLAPATVVDVGANRGQFSVLCVGLLPDVNVIAFEPLAGAADRFRALELGSRVRLVQAAVAKSNGEATMHRSNRDDSSSLLPIGSAQVANFPGTHEAGTETVRTVRLDDVVTRDELRSPSLLKIDVQGFEFEVLEASEALLSAFSCILVELSLVELYIGQRLASEVISWLHAHGFDLVEIAHVTKGANGASIQADLLFGNRQIP